MQFTTALLTLAAAGSALAAPAPATAKSMTANVPEWTIEGLVRSCNAEDTSCHWSFTIDTHTSAPVPCAYDQTGAPASQAQVNGVTCGQFAVSSGWDGSWGPGNGFTTLAVKDEAARQIAWPSYTDKQLVNGQVVSPDQSWAVSTIG
ncbi:uncharacterized protein E0L32_009944 [Thyridium curvatum]|uniref:Uncharacterized protein n=1 Tax=Thyridium curvatum TaxID=1093900 RepID=A0A507AG10_9PEZI|nr:uncharacterized protein E0L32_009944 [Thyridium curvatum]TPX08605.1 hypothetical protein E0L32_009944 [Thyridium curvatum]